MFSDSSTCTLRKIRINLKRTKYVHCLCTSLFDSSFAENERSFNSHYFFATRMFLNDLKVRPKMNGTGVGLCKQIAWLFVCQDQSQTGIPDFNFHFRPFQWTMQSEFLQDTQMFEHPGSLLLRVWSWIRMEQQAVHRYVLLFKSAFFSNRSKVSYSCRTMFLKTVNNSITVEFWYEEVDASQWMS